MATIGIVDSDKSSRSVIRDCLTGAGYKVFEAGTVEEALELMEDNGDPDLLWFDPNGEKQSDLGLISILSSAEDKFPVIICSKDRIETSRIRYKGPLFYLEKDNTFPMQKQRYLEAVENLIDES